MIHAVKVLPEFYAALNNGTKTFEVREKDRLYEVGDFLAVNEYEPISDPYELPTPLPEARFCRADGKGHYSGECLLFRITYILDNVKYCAPNTVILGLSRCEV